LKHDRLIGARNSQNEQIKGMESELGKQAHRTADEDYRKMLITLTTTEMVSGDLDKYHKALDK
jgi:hypothetical protein